MTPGGLRLGAPALTSRGFVEKDFEQVCYNLYFKNFSSLQYHFDFTDCRVFSSCN